MLLRCLACFSEYSGARICFEGRSHSSAVACSVLKPGIKQGKLQAQCISVNLVLQDGSESDHAREHEEQDVADDEVAREHAHLRELQSTRRRSAKSYTELEFEESHLDDRLARRLRPGRRAHTATVPLAGPPCPVDLVVLVLAGNTDRDQELEDEALDAVVDEEASELAARRARESKTRTRPKR